MKCNLIGAGRLGKNIALSTKHIITSFSICNRNPVSAQKASHELGFGLAVANIEQLPAAEITWISCNDDAIHEVVETLTRHPVLKPGSFVIHCSGALNSNILAPLKAQGCLVGSFHPLKAFKTNYLDPAAFNKVDCILEGDDEVCAWLKQSFMELGANLITIQPEAKTAYHAAACMASNYLITLASCSEALFLQAGIDSQQSRRMMLNLMQGNLHNLQQIESIAESLTGPLVRGDINTISLHLQSIQNSNIKQFYQTAALCTLPLTQLSEEMKQKIHAMLAE